jgi:hypothetical protein
MKLQTLLGAADLAVCATANLKYLALKLRYTLLTLALASLAITGCNSQPAPKLLNVTLQEYSNNYPILQSAEPEYHGITDMVFCDKKYSVKVMFINNVAKMVALRKVDGSPFSDSEFHALLDANIVDNLPWTNSKALHNNDPEANGWQAGTAFIPEAAAALGENDTEFKIFDVGSLMGNMIGNMGKRLSE